MTTKISKNNSTPAAKDRLKKPETSAQHKSESQVLLANALGQIEKTFGKGSIMKLTEETSGLAIQGISTGRSLVGSRPGGTGFPAGPGDRAFRAGVER